MPTRVGALSPSEGTMSSSAGVFLASILYVPSSAFLSAPSLNNTLPSAVNVMLVPAGGLSGLPPRTPLSPTHSPTIDGGSLAGASFLAGAPTTMARPMSRDVVMGGSVGG